MKSQSQSVTKELVTKGEPSIDSPRRSVADTCQVAAQPRYRAGRDDEAGLDLWVRRCCALVVASVAADASYVHQRAFALRGGADATSAVLWPLSVDGLLLLATVSLLKPVGGNSRRARVVVWLAFLFGIGISLAANIAAAPTLAWQPILVAGWPPVALLLSVELLTHRSRGAAPGSDEQRLVSAERSRPLREPTPNETLSTERKAARSDGENSVGRLAEPVGPRPGSRRSSAEQLMWSHFQQQRAQGRTPTGAELDRVAGTNNYGRAVLAKWRRSGRAEPETGGRNG